MRFCQVIRWVVFFYKKLSKETNDFKQAYWQVELLPETITDLSNKIRAT